MRFVEEKEACTPWSCSDLCHSPGFFSINNFFTFARLISFFHQSLDFLSSFSLLQQYPTSFTIPSARDVSDSKESTGMDDILDVVCLQINKSVDTITKKKKISDRTCSEMMRLFKKNLSYVTD